ncbi:MAG TPA: isocitrate lyase/phosphoenolpyruvate mutase family protein [Candidatus Binatia bacterium]|nr:isocitrate lyase/phosphoenolpyruvate mutase family protein [Candidatus Binatia bacterium]
MKSFALGLRFRDLHRSGTLVLPNAWDAASAAIAAAAGAEAVATTSSGISWSLGVPDGEQLSRADMIDVVARVARSVDVPVSADVEAGYGPVPSDVAATIAAVIDAGAVGANLEDRLRTDDGPLWPIARQCERLAAARDAADRSGVAFVLNARTDVFLAAVGDPADREGMVLERAEAYRRAGADCLFVPGLVDLDAIARLVRASALPLNVMLSPGQSPTIRQLAEAGVRRISAGHAVAGVAYGATGLAMRELLAGRDGALRDGASHGDMQQLMARPAAR